MAVPGHSPTDDDDEDSFDMRALWRLSLWGIAASIAVGLVVAAGSTEIGSQRVTLAWAGLKAPLDGPRALPPAQIARTNEADNESRRLALQLRAITADRERLLARLDAVERSLEDVTGSIARQPQPTAPRAEVDLPIAVPAPELPQVVAPKAAAARPETAVAGQAPEIGWAASVAQPPGGGEQPDWPGARPGTAAVAAAPAPSTAPATTVIRTEFGVDIGGGTTVSAIRTLWLSIRSSHPTLFEGLRPVVTIRDNSRGATELRLIAGPLANAATAARLCGSLSSAGLTCQPAVFDGQRLALR